MIQPEKKGDHFFIQLKNNLPNLHDLLQLNLELQQHG
jgi:hypothetical protein